MLLYGKSARFDSAHQLSDEELYKMAPSIFAVEPHDSRSERFVAIPTIDVLNGLRKEGFFPVMARQGNSRDEGKRNYTKHMIRLRRFDNVDQYKVGDNVCEIILKNANDGTSAYDLMAGLFRIRCMNSLVAQTSTIDSVKVRHSGQAVGNVIEGTYRVLGEAQNLLTAPQDWGNINVSKEAETALAEAAHIIRFGDAEGNVDTAIHPRQLLVPRRPDDQASDLWTKFNVVQENCIRGGMTGRQYDEHTGRRTGRRVTTREVKGIEQDVRLNKALWVLGERMAQLIG